ncbi:hypothetical protein B0H12DRAFT_1134340, partial [Mycena haematopus]
MSSQHILWLYALFCGPHRAFRLSWEFLLSTTIATQVLISCSFYPSTMQSQPLIWFNAGIADQIGLYEIGM